MTKRFSRQKPAAQDTSTNKSWHFFPNPCLAVSLVAVPVGFLALLLTGCSGPTAPVTKPVPKGGTVGSPAVGESPPVAGPKLVPPLGSELPGPDKPEEHPLPKTASPEPVLF